jgi:hypothetical protein
MDDAMHARRIEQPHEKRLVEIRTYNLEPGSGGEFQRLVEQQSVPMLRRWNVDLVAHGPSRHDAESYVLIRAYDSLDDRRRSEDAFYSSDEWRDGLQQKILAHIDSYTTAVVELDTETIDGLRQATGLEPTTDPDR